ncbi:MAG: cysteine hydrolase [Rhodobacteraceae bacterium]|nr:cysteine hydrolase [Paracoccaceae bacterium]
MNHTALLIIDVQEAFNQRVALGHKRNAPYAEANIARLLDAFRLARWPVFHIRHASSDPASLFHPDRSGYAPQTFVQAAPGEREVIKTVNSSFIGTSLEMDLRRAGITDTVICGATTNHCVETTTRMAGNLGFEAHLVRDACWAFEQTGPDGEMHGAEDIHQMSLSNLHREFAQITTTASLISAIITKTDNRQ